MPANMQMVNVGKFLVFACLPLLLYINNLTFSTKLCFRPFIATFYYPLCPLLQRLLAASAVSYYLPVMASSAVCRFLLSAYYSSVCRLPFIVDFIRLRLPLWQRTNLLL